MSYSPYVTIQYSVLSGSGQIADSTICPQLSGYGQIVKIPIWYISNMNYGKCHVAPRKYVPVPNDLENESQGHTHIPRAFSNEA